MTIEIIRVDYSDEQQANDLLFCLNNYAIDPMGGGEPLTAKVKETLIEALKQQSNVFSVLAYVNGKPAGLINCVDGFSTFSASPLINIHDVVVLKAFRGQSLTRKMFRLVEQIAKEKGAIKLTLEVLEGNTVAKQAYQRLGFAGYQLDPAMGQAVFWQKSL